MSATLAPGLYFQAIRAPADPSPLRSDIAGFIGRTRRGPPGVAVRVTGPRECQSIFGGFLADADTSLALRGYFGNGGDVAWIVRLDGPKPAQTADTTWDVTRPKPAAPGDAPQWNPAEVGFTANTYRVVATSPGLWGNAVRVSARYSKGPPARLDFNIRAPDEADEILTGLDPARFPDQIAARSGLIRVVPLDLASPVLPKADGPNFLTWSDLALGNGTDAVPSTPDYLNALTLLGDQVEVALVVMPDLCRDLDESDVFAIEGEAVAQADLLHDRMVLLDLPDGTNVQGAIDWSRRRRIAFATAARAAAAYFPAILTQDPLGGIAQPLRQIAPSGHVCGVISRLDRERGAQYTPANVTVEDTVDVAAGYSPADRARCNEAGIDLLRCMPGQGIQIWGGRTLFPGSEGRYIAHRRLIHRLVRAVRQVAEPLVFESNGPALWLALSRAATTVLLEAWRAGGLQGDSADQAFQVRCDAGNNPSDNQDLGLTLCEIALAPAVPMEFITLRVTLSAQGSLDVFEQ